MNLKVLIISFATFAALAIARPLLRDAAPSDIDILNLLLTLEHIENAFYSQGLSSFTQEDFVDAGFPDWSYGRFKQIAAHEAAHVQVLEITLGDKASKPCTYKFPYHDPKSFVTLSHDIEVIGDSAYIGASKFFQDKEYLLAAATILSTESRHSAWLDSAIRKGSAWSGPFDTPLDLNQAYTIASSFITSCPPTNPKLLVTTYSQLTVPEPASAWPGATTLLEFTTPRNFDHSAPLYGAFISGQEAVIVPLVGKSVSIPDDLRGVVYLLVTVDADNVDDSKIIAGPALFEFSFDSNGDLQRQSS
ncbi:ferritin-like domain-containing protein [Russula earlei]|uniref:Ferritin-like domain-containing protein n=1 Tax=Russula earlei TaxID=71964 RepID=A0ACC0UCM6_9AGAM|nr:ferritin-like domain-containing protein [Russula earlei]